MGPKFPFMVIIDEKYQCSRRKAESGGTESDHDCNCTRQYIALATSPDGAARVIRDLRKEAGCAEAPNYTVYSLTQDTPVWELDDNGGSSADESLADTLYNMFEDGPVIVSVI